MPFRLFPARVYPWVIAGLLLLLGCSLLNRAAHFDDAWIAEQSYWLWHDGHARSELFRGVNGAENRLYIFHKAFVYVQAPVLALFNFSLWGAKAPALLFAAVGLGLLLRCFRGPAAAEARWLTATLYLGCGSVARFGSVGRPETLVMCAGFGSFLALRTAAGRPGRLLLAGGLAGLAALAHLNGTVYLATGALWLLWGRAGWRAVAWFTLAGAATFGLYFLDMLAPGRLDQFLHQFLHAPITQANLHSASKLELLLDYQRLFFHSEAEAFLSAALLLVLVVARWAGRDARPAPLTAAGRYLLLLLLVFGLIAARISAYYLLLFVPFMIVVLVETALAAAPHLTGGRRTALLAGLALYPMGSGLRAYNQWVENRARPPLEEENARLAAFLPRQGSRVVAPLDFFFGQARHYRIRGLTSYAMLNATYYADTLHVPAFFRLLHQDSVRYLITDHLPSTDVYFVPPGAPARIGHYQRVFQNQWHSVYVRQ